MANESRLRAYGTHGLILINLSFFFFQIFSSKGGIFGWDISGNDLNILYQLGLGPEKVWSGQWWRLLSANFLHLGWIHLFSNMLGLYFLGRFVENNLGLGRYLLAYFVSGVGSMLAFSILAIEMDARHQILVGASAAIMGLIGVIFAIFLKVWLEEKSSLAAKRLRILFFMVGVQFAMDLALPQVSLLSHVLGLIIGFLTGKFLLINWRFQR